MVCKWVRLAYRLLPLTGWRAFLLDRHIDRCPECQGAALDDAAIRSLGVTPSNLLAELPLSPIVAGSKPSRAKAFPIGWRYAFGLFLAAITLWAVVAISRIAPLGTLPQGTVTVTEAGEDTCVFAVLEAKIGGEPARPVIFKPGQPGMTIVWFEKRKN